MKVIKPKAMATTGSFARASSGTFFGSNGLLQTAATNVLRLQYNPITLAFNGLLIETASTNLILQSETFDNASWTKTKDFTLLILLLELIKTLLELMKF